MLSTDVESVPATRLFFVMVGGRDLALASAAECDRVKHASVAAARSGGDIVRFGALGGGWIDVLVTAGLPLSFQEIDVPAYEVMPAEESLAELSAFSDYMD
jgi:hypothetical protein